MHSVTLRSSKCFYNLVMSSFFTTESIMGNSLHNKIYLGRRSVALGTKRVQALLCVAAFASIGAVWLLIRAL